MQRITSCTYALDNNALYCMNAFLIHFYHHESCILVFTDIIVKDMRFVDMLEKKLLVLS